MWISVYELYVMRERKFVGMRIMKVKERAEFEVEKPNMRQSFFVVVLLLAAAIKYTLIKFFHRKMHYQIIHAKHDRIKTMCCLHFSPKKLNKTMLYFNVHICACVMVPFNIVFNQINFQFSLY